MARISQKDIIKRHLEWRWGLWRDGLASHPWVPSYDLRGARLTIDRHGGDGWSGHQGDRRARELAQAGEVFRKIGDDRGIVWYAADDPLTVVDRVPEVPAA